MSAFGNLAEEIRSVFFFQRLAGGDGASPPRPAFKSSLHEIVADANGEILILIHDAPVSIPVVGTVISGVDQSPSLFLLLLFCVDEFFNVAVPIAQGVHFGGAAGFAPRFHHVGYLVVNAQKRQRPAGSTAAAEFLPTGSQRSQVSAGAGTVLEEHRLAGSQPHDVFHVVLHRLNEAGAALRIFVLSGRPSRLVCASIVKPIALRRVLSHAVLMPESDVEPNWRIKSAVLMQTKPAQLRVKHLAFLLAEITVVNTPIRNRPTHSMNHLADRTLSPGSSLLAVKILGNHHLRRQQRPRLWHIDVVLSENRAAALIRDFHASLLPIHRIKGILPLFAENSLNQQPLATIWSGCRPHGRFTDAYHDKFEIGKIKILLLMLPFVKRKDWKNL